MKKVIAVIVAIVVFTLPIAILTGCNSEAVKVNANLSKEADRFQCERKITVYNARTDAIIFTLEGYISIANNANGELVVTAKVGEESYKKNYIYLNDFTLYVVEDITGTHTDPYHYEILFHTNILPDIEIVP